MPTEKEEQQHAPETDRTYERAEPEDETGTGEMADQRNTPTDSPAGVQSSVQNDRIRMPMNADDITDDDAALDPAAPSGKTDANPKNAVPAAGTQPGKSDATRKEGGRA